MSLNMMWKFDSSMAGASSFSPCPGVSPSVATFSGFFTRRRALPLGMPPQGFLFGLSGGCAAPHVVNVAFFDVG